jgi:hypothetical protein
MLHMGKKKEENLPQIKSRTTKDPLKIQSGIKLQDGLRILGEDGMRTKGHPSIEFTMTISRHDLQRLHFLALNYPEYFAKGFHQEFILPALHHTSKGARGKFKGKETTLFWIKAEAAELYNLFKFLRRTGKRPSYFKALLKKLETLKDHHKLLFFDKHGNPDPVALTAYCIELYLRRIGKPLDSLELDSFCQKLLDGDALDNFYVHHIKAYKPIFRFTKDTSDKDLEDLSKEPPFSYIFESLKLL